MSVASMTGFGSGSAIEGAEQITVELRSVNGKFCEVKARLPRELAPFETEFVKQIKGRVARGNVDASVRRGSAENLPAMPVVNAKLVQAYATALREAAKEAG